MAAPKKAVGSKSEKIWRDAVMRAIRRLETDTTPKKPKPQQRLDLLADALVKKGIAEDVAALREIGDRIDGKPTQQITGPDGGAMAIFVIENGPKG